eukprot:gb/GEZN01001302.1/.p1 GENE.gb/GEZN01001302.1/~~gb/GEZN01001302.1/.p1  ORF type:complete len:951 (+),score=165.81 gb/GEZN01001302.1/:19-2871(+)
MPPKKKQKTEGEGAEVVQVRLPSGIVPSHYDLTLVPDFNSFIFQAYIKIDVDVKPGADTNAISLHAVDLTFAAKDVSLVSYGDAVTQLNCSSVQQDPKMQTATFVFGSGKLCAGLYTMQILYRGALNDQLCGLYRSTYIGPDGQSKLVLCTQFEATDARKCLPCWDEPARKATFDVTVVVPSHLQAVSNMPIKSQETVLPPNSLTKDQEKEAKLQTYNTSEQETKVVGGRGGLQYPLGWKSVSYMRSPVMSTYLLAMVVGEFDFIAGLTQGLGEGARPVQVRVWTPPGKTAQGHFALQVATRALDFYNQWFGIPYPLPKVDLLAIPDFAAGAMENWGCITYREVRLLVDPVGSSQESKRATARTICHELAHMWFGNLVTMDWWTNLWLNEGFARFMEFLALDTLFPEWDIWTEFTTSVLSSARSLDALQNTHPVEVPVKWPEEINEIFDTISYAKGGSVIRMIASTLGTKAFQAGLQRYLKQHQYSNAHTAQLWDALQQASGQDVVRLLDPWVKQCGYPVVTLQQLTSNTDGSVSVTLSQRRFFSAACSSSSPSSADCPWTVPLTLQLGPDRTRTWQILLEPGSASQTFSSPTASGHGAVPWVKINLGASTLCRVHYQDNNLLLGALSGAVREGKLAPTDRLDLVQDAFALASAGLLALPVALRFLTSCFVSERNPSVWDSIAAALSPLIALHAEEGNPHADGLRALVIKLCQDIYQEVGWTAKPGESESTAALRPMVLKMLAMAGQQDVAQQARLRLASFLLDPEAHPLSADLREVVYEAAVRNGGRDNKEWNAVQALYRKTDLSEEKRRCLLALGKCPQDATLVAQTLRWATEQEEVRDQDLYLILSSLASHSVGRIPVWHWLKSNWPKLDAKYGRGGQNFIFGALVGAAINGWSTEEAADDFDSFFREHPCPAATRIIAQAGERVRAKAKQRVRQNEELTQDANWRV